MYHGGLYITQPTITDIMEGGWITQIMNTHYTIIISTQDNKIR